MVVLVSLIATILLLILNLIQTQLSIIVLRWALLSESWGADLIELIDISHFHDPAMLQESTRHALDHRGGAKLVGI